MKPNVSTYCRNCEGNRVHYFKGEQLDKEGDFCFDIYICEKCGDSKGMNKSLKQIKYENELEKIVEKKIE